MSIIGSKSILIFNPDTDYALASGSDFYTPPNSIKGVVAQRPAQALAWGKAGDIILLPDWLALDPDCRLIVEEVTERASRMDIETAWPEKLTYWGDDDWSRVETVKPWGWNPALRHTLEEARVPTRLLPSKEVIERWRGISHRRSTTDFNLAMGFPFCPQEINSIEEALQFWYDNPGCWFKAPWSSSGRGVLCTRELEFRHIEPWLRGVIRRQGSVMAEKGAEKMLDFASEWYVEDGKAVFLGLSLFSVSGRGKYTGNKPLPQQAIRKQIGDETMLGNVIAKQGEVIDRLISQYYYGPLGIDMLLDSGGVVWPCIEINLRRTMGHVYLGHV